MSNTDNCRVAIDHDQPEENRHILLLILMLPNGRIFTNICRLKQHRWNYGKRKTGKSKLVDTHALSTCDVGILTNEVEQRVANK